MIFSSRRIRQLLRIVKRVNSFQFAVEDMQAVEHVIHSTGVSIRQLKLVHGHTHPAEQQPEGAATKEGDAQARAELLSTLDVEGEEDE